MRTRCSHGAVRRPEGETPKMRTPHKDVATTLMRWLLVITIAPSARGTEISAAKRLSAKHEASTRVRKIKKVEWSEWISDIEGKAARVAASEGGQRVRLQ